MRNKPMTSVLFMLLFFLFSCDFSFNVLGNRDYGFDDKILIASAPVDGDYNFIVLSDLHFGRSNTDSNSETFTEAFLGAYKMQVDENNVDAVIILGDAMDSFIESDKKDFLDFLHAIDTLNMELEDAGTTAPKVIFVPGNHDLTNGSIDNFISFLHDQGEDALKGRLMLASSDTGSFGIGSDLTIYMTNSAHRMFGLYQLTELEEAMEKDTARFKMILSHVPLSADKFDQSIFNFILASSEERNTVIRLMTQYGPSFMLSGHHHVGEILNDYNGKAKEFIFAAFNKKESSLYDESDGVWYLMNVDMGRRESTTISLHSFLAENGERLASRSFSLER